MKLISNQRTDTNTVELEIELSAGELEAAALKVYRRKSKSITVPGFRKGKAPRQIIEKIYGSDVFLEDAINDLYPEAYRQAVSEAGIEPVDRADVEIISADAATGVTFKTTVTVKPEVTLGQYKGIAVDKIIHTVTEDEIDHELGHLQERNARIITVEDRAAQTGDDVNIDYSGSVDGVLFDGGTAQGQQLTLGSGSFIDTFEEQVAGHRPGDEFDVSVTFPAEYHAEELKGKPAVFRVKLNEIKAKELPELDDEFAKDVSEFDTLAELRGDLRKKRQEAADRDSRTETENKLLEAVVAQMQAEVPVCMIEQRMDDIVRDFEYRLRSQGMNLEMYLQYLGSDLATFREPMRPQAEQQVKTRLALEKIVELEGLTADPKELETEYQNLAESYQMDLKQVLDAVSATELAHDICTNKALDIVRDSAVITEKAEETAAEKTTAAPPKKAAAKKEKAAETEKEAKPKKAVAVKAKKAESPEKPVKSKTKKKDAK